MENNVTIARIAKNLPIISKALMMIVVSCLIPLMFPHQGHGDHYDYSLGGVWRNNDLVAPYDFVVQKSQGQIDYETETAKSKMLLYYHYNETAHAQAVEQLDQIARRHPEVDMREMRKSLDRIYQQGYLELPPDLPDFESHTLILLEGNIGSEHLCNEYCTPLDVTDTLLRDSILLPSIAFDANRTKLEFDSRLSQIATSAQVVEQGELIVAQGDYVSRDQADKISSLESENDRRFQENDHPFWRYVGQIILCIIAFIALYMFLKNVRHPLLNSDRKITFVMVLILLMSGIIAIVTRTNPGLVLIVPMCIVPIMMLVFFDMRVALYVHVTTIVILANMVPNAFEFIFYQLIAGMMSIVTVRNFESRSKFLLVSLVIFITYSLIYTFGVLSQESSLANISLNRYITFLLNALLTLLAFPLIYIFERLFGFTTNLTLMELSSTNTPALRELSRNAPGTFQHSMQVANISEDLINEIGGNALLAKVGALYHDIGKINAPFYFVENQTSEYNPHDELEYADSAEMIIKHVEEGMKLAQKYHLPAAVVEFIRQHHGTTLTGYFYMKQKETYPNEPIDIDMFRYGGPTPSTREIAVVMIVDSVEAACRSLKSHDKESIDKLVDSIIDSKINAKQFDECDFTFSDISATRQFLKKKMVSIYHSRIAYPTAK